MNFFKSKFERRFLENVVARPSELLNWMCERVDPGRTRIILAAAPKSGSTFLTAALGHLTGLKARDLISGSGRVDYQIYVPKLVAALDRDAFIGHQHLRASTTDLKILQTFGFRAIVLVRDFADSVVSLRDHCQREFSGPPTEATDFQDINGRDSDSQFRFIIRLHMPWFYSFFTTWKAAEDRGVIEIHWLRYEDLIADPRRELSAISDFCGLSRSPSEVEVALAKAGGQWTRKNVGVAGRGKQLLSPEHIAALEEMAALYHNVDFSMVGLGSEKQDRN